MKRTLNFLTGKHSILTLIITLLLLDTLLVASVFIPPIMGFLADKHLFEIVVLSSIVEILLILSSDFWRSTPMVIGSEDESQEIVKDLLDKDRSIKSVKVLSAGLRSRAAFLRYLLEMPRHLSLEVVASFGERSFNPDDLDRNEFGPAHYNVIVHRLDREEAARLRIYKLLNTPSFRCMLLLDSNGVKYGVVGWYTYHKKNAEIVGRRNPQIVIDRTTDTGLALLRFAEKFYEKNIVNGEVELLFPKVERENEG